MTGRVLTKVTRSFFPPRRPVDRPGLGPETPCGLTEDRPRPTHPQRLLGRGNRGWSSGGSPAPRHAPPAEPRFRRWPITVAHHDDCGVMQPGADISETQPANSTASRNSGITFRASRGRFRVSRDTAPVTIRGHREQDPGQEARATGRCRRSGGTSRASARTRSARRSSSPISAGRPGGPSRAVTTQSGQAISRISHRSHSISMAPPVSRSCMPFPVGSRRTAAMPQALVLSSCPDVRPGRTDHTVKRGADIPPVTGRRRPLPSPGPGGCTTELWGRLI